MASKRPLVLLASQSPRRKKILSFLSVPFEVVKPQGVDETPFKNESERQLVRRLALLKAESISRLRPNMPVLAADTIVFKNGHVFGKPQNSVEAKEMLMALSGKKHEVWTGTALVWKKQKISISSIEVTKVYFRKLKKAEIDVYLNTQEPYDKAGAYDIQGTASGWIKKWEGDYFNVMGLPIQWVVRQISLIKSF
jgi:septum formation protein